MISSLHAVRVGVEEAVLSTDAAVSSVNSADAALENMGILGMKPARADKFKRNASEPRSFYPSPFARKQSTPTIKTFKELKVEQAYAGDKKILVLGTSKYLLRMKNGKLFNTGHQSTETFVPLYHFDKAGFKFDFATEDGAPLAVEEWSFPFAKGYEKKIREIRNALQSQLQNPKKYEDISEGLDGYAAVFMPGGHGPVIDMPNQESLGRLLRSAHSQGMTTISLCHGPAAFLAGAVGGEFPYKDYKIAVFPDKVDKMTPKIGYLPGYIREEDQIERKLKEKGCRVQNKKMDDTVVVDRELITGASQLASQKLAEKAIKILAEKFEFKVKVQ